MRPAATFSQRGFFGDSLFSGVLKIAAVAVLLLLGGLFISLVTAALPSLKRFGLHFFIGMNWDPVSGEFGALPFITGTLLTSFIALVIAVPFSVAVSVFLGDFYREGRISRAITSAVELLAGIPSIIYGFWGIFFLVPLVRRWEVKLGILPYGVGILTASLILAIMIIPYSASLGREVISMVPADLKEAAYALGATRFEVIKWIVAPYARAGLLSGIMLALGRALGETMAVTMLIGNSNFLPDSLFSPANSMASLIANEFTEATGDLYLSALIEMGLLLFLITMILNVLGRIVIRRYDGLH